MENKFALDLLSSIEITELQESYEYNLDKLREDYFSLGDLNIYLLTMLGTDYWKKQYVDSAELTEQQIEVMTFVESVMPYIHPQGRIDESRKAKKARSQSFIDNAIIATFSLLFGAISIGNGVPEEVKDISDSKIIKQVEEIANSKELTNSEKIEIIKIKLNDSDDVKEIIEIYTNKYQ